MGGVVLFNMLFCGIYLTSSAIQRSLDAGIITNQSHTQQFGPILEKSPVLGCGPKTQQSKTTKEVPNPTPKPKSSMKAN